MLLSVLGKYLGVEWLGHEAGLTLKKPARCSPRHLCHFAVPLAVCKASSSPTSSPALGMVNVHNFLHLSRCVGYLIAVLFCISLLTSDAGHLVTMRVASMRDMPSRMEMARWKYGEILGLW